MFPRSESQPAPSPVVAVGGRFNFPARLRSLPFLRIAAAWEAFLVALASLRQNKLRTGLTLIGIVVGVTAVIAVDHHQGLDQTVAQAFFAGLDRFTISKRPRDYLKRLHQIQ
jgi:hypothetical protein